MSLSLLARLPVEPSRLISFYLSSSTSRRFLTTTTVVKNRDKKAYSHTLLLPKSSLPVKHKDPAAFESTIRKLISDDLYKWQVENNHGPSFVFLDGPPYANGNLHMGHALNKILKDIINRYKVMRGYRVHFVPGWDCHGLPIEQKALAALGKSHTTLEPKHIRDVARRAALEAIEVQKAEMKELGVMADWDGKNGTYRTLDHTFEVAQLKLLQSMINKGLVTHRLRPTYYSPASRTALAEAELKYEDKHQSRSIYVKFPVDTATLHGGPLAAWKEGDEPSLSLAIWTTTPWTLASNLGVAIHRDLTYVMARTAKGDDLILQQDRVEPLKPILGELSVISTFPGSDLIGTRYSHTFAPSASAELPTIMHADHVSAESGTGVVHMAPAHGHEDYQAFMAADLLPANVRCPIDDDGKFTGEVVEWSSASHDLVGKEVLGAGNNAMIDLLRQSNVVLAEQDIEHKYPYDWKTKTPVIIRATPQWFADVGTIKSRAIRALDAVNFHPPAGRQRLESFVGSRAEWCISRQRSWGVPIPILFTLEGDPILDSESLQHSIDVLSKNGMDHWWTGPIDDFISPSNAGAQLVKGKDTLDVWFDSGSAWTSLEQRDPSVPLADICLEGSDQHRGWFQSSLLTRLSVTKEDTAVARALITHGFIVDKNGRKMSKSDGNGVSPGQIIHGENGKTGFGADTLRIWAASVDYTRDVALGPTSMSQASELLRKWRSVLRFMLGVTSTSVPDGSDKSLVDRYVLSQLAELERGVIIAYDEFAFNKAVQSINAFTGTTLSSIYFDSIKDVLYCDPANSPRRLAVVSTLKEVLHKLLKMMAPITPYLSQEVYEHALPESKLTVFAETWNGETALDADQDKIDMDVILSLRQQVLSGLEALRMAKDLRLPAEADLYIVNSPTELSDLLQANASILPGLFGTSQVVFGSPSSSMTWSHEIRVKGRGDMTMGIIPARRRQCLRCWRYDAELDAGSKDGVCDRCRSAVAAG